jgi:hypothetical protein
MAGAQPVSQVREAIDTIPTWAAIGKCRFRIDPMLGAHGERCGMDRASAAGRENTDVTWN